MAANNNGNKKSTNNKSTKSGGGSKPAAPKNSAATGRGGSSSTAKKGGSQKISAEEMRKAHEAQRQYRLILLSAACILLLALTLLEGQSVWKVAHDFLFKLSGFCTWLWPVTPIVGTYLYLKDRGKKSIALNTAGVGFITLLLSGILHIAVYSAADSNLDIDTASIGTQVKFVWLNFSTLKGGGFSGVITGGVFCRLCGKVPAMVLMLLAVAVIVMLLTGTTIMQLGSLAKRGVHGVKSESAARIERSAHRREERALERAQRKEEALEKKKFNPNIAIGEVAPPIEDELPEPGTTVSNSKDDGKYGLPDFMYAEPDKAMAVDLPKKGNDAVKPNIHIHDSRMKPPVLIDEHDISDLEPIPVIHAPEPFNPDSFSEPPAPEDIPSPDLPHIEPKNDSGFDKVKVVPDSEIISAPEPAFVYRKPPLNCLAPATVSGFTGYADEIEQNSKKLIDTLASFGQKAIITDVYRGPSVTRYELQPAEGVRISKITGLADDIALRLAASGVRIEAPIPNKSAIGIEVPNKSKATVSFREIVDTPEFKNSKSKLTVALGKDITGNVICADLAKMPHLLIAGTTGSGKSVCMNSMIVSLLFNATPNEVKLLMIDPKQVEFTVYNGIPHLLVPVVSDARKASGALNWAVTEMLHRYKLFSEKNVRDMTGYNRLAAKQEGMEVMSQIVIFIDELSDLMMVAPNEVEDAICRLAQMARAAGIHLVIATQRPSVDVITGIIKANIPSRIALAVSSQIDSRTILDTGGAEKLLGMGDMLFNPIGKTKPLRVQGCFLSDSEVENVVSFVREQSEDNYHDDIMDEIERNAATVGTKKKGGGASASSSDGSDSDEDEMLPNAIEVVVEAQMASTTLLQKRLKLGYARASRIMDQLEDNNIIGPFEGSKPRKVLISKQDWMEKRALAGDFNTDNE